MIRQQVDDRPGLKIHKDRSARSALAPGPLINATRFASGASHHCSTDRINPMQGEDVLGRVNPDLLGLHFGRLDDLIQNDQTSDSMPQRVNPNAHGRE